MNFNKSVTLVFSSYRSDNLLKRIIKKLPKNYKILVIENSLNKKIKKILEKKFKNVEVLLPKENLGLARSYNLGIKKAKTKYVFLNNPDLEIKNDSIKKLIRCAESLKNFGIISPTYKNEKIFKNYEILKYRKKNNSPVFKKFGVMDVDIIDNSFIVKRKNIQKFLFDEKYFLYFETFDFCKNLKMRGKNLFVCNKIKYHHYGSSSVDHKFDKIVKLTRAFHYNWSKFYYFRKHNNYLFAFKKIIPNLFNSFKKILFSILKFDKKNLTIGLIELYGILCAILLLPSFYRPRM